jgi:hypothetical protein
MNSTELDSGEDYPLHCTGMTSIGPQMCYIKEALVPANNLTASVTMLTETRCLSFVSNDVSYNSYLFAI